MKEKIIIGSGGFAREIRAEMGSNDIKCFVSDEYYSPNDNNIYPLSEFDVEKYSVVVGIGDPIARKKIVESLPMGTEFFTYVSPRATILGTDVEIGEGSFICAGTIITCNVKIGKHVHLNLLTTVGHDTIIGDYLTTAPDVNISGNVTIGDCVYIGTNTAIREKINICSDVVIGLNSGIVSHITESGLYVGTPQKKIK